MFWEFNQNEIFFWENKWICFDKTLYRMCVLPRPLQFVKIHGSFPSLSTFLRFDIKWWDIFSGQSQNFEFMKSLKKFKERTFGVATKFRALWRNLWRKKIEIVPHHRFIWKSENLREPWMIHAFPLNKNSSKFYESEKNLSNWIGLKN